MVSAGALLHVTHPPGREDAVRAQVPLAGALAEVLIGADRTILITLPVVVDEGEFGVLQASLHLSLQVQ